MTWPTSLLVQESQGITAPLRGYESELARSAQMVNREKDLVPCEVGAAPHQVFDVARRYRPHYVDHLIFRGDLLRHVPPFEGRNELLGG